MKRLQWRSPGTLLGYTRSSLFWADSFSIPGCPHLLLLPCLGPASSNNPHCPPGPSPLPTTWNPSSRDQERTAKERPQGANSEPSGKWFPESYLATLRLGTSWPTRAGSTSHWSPLCTLTGWSVFSGHTCGHSCNLLALGSHSLPVPFAWSALMPLMPTYALGLLLPVHSPAHLQPATSRPQPPRASIPSVCKPLSP